MPRKRRKSSAPERLAGNLVDHLFERAGLARQVREWKVLAAFREVAGAHIHAHARADRVHGSTLYVRVASAAWAQELSFHRRDLLARLRAIPGSGWLEDLRFAVGPLDAVPDFGRASDGAAGGAAEARPRETPPLDDGAVARELLRIRDPELRAAAAELYARARRR